MWYLLKVYSKDRWVRYFYLGSFVLQAGLWVEVIRNVGFINKTITLILHTTIVTGANLYSQWYSIYYIPLIGLILMLSNFMVGLWLFRKEPILARILAGCTVLVEIALGIALSIVIRINT